MNQTAIQVRNVTKKFRVHLNKNTTLKEKILYRKRSLHEEYLALQDVSLDIKKGSTVGLIGVNGSGKSTLLKIMSKILYPDSGQVIIQGRVSSLLELGAGFHPDFSGRENIFMNGALLGLSTREIRNKLDEIIEFAELDDFIDQPVRSYSSGMYMRLAFSVAVAIDPEILLIDEILAVGDAAFQAKCMSRIKQLKAQGKTIIMVTHDMGAVERFCDTAVWIHKSKLYRVGEPVACIQEYLDTVFRNSHQRKATAVNGQKEILIDLSKGNRVEPKSNRFGNGKVKMNKVEVLSESRNNLIKTGCPCDIVVEYEAFEDVSDVVFGFSFFSEDGTQCYGTNTFLDRVGTKFLKTGIGSYKIKIAELPLLQGNYYLNLAVHSNEGEPFDFWKNAQVVNVTSDITEKGYMRIPHEWRFT